MNRIFSMILVVVLSASLLMFAMATETGTAINFSDVDKTSVAGQAIYKLANAGILKGDGNGIFRPNDPIRRSELTKIVNSIFGYTQKAEIGFSDLRGNEWFYDNVLIAKQAGYIQGYDDGTFKADYYVSREQACAILCRVASLYDLSLNFEIKDPVSDWAKPYVQKVLANSMMSLEEGNTFRAQMNITRAEFSVVYANFLKEVATASPSASPTSTPGNGGTGNGGTGNGSTATQAPTASAKPTATASPSTSANPTASPSVKPSSNPTTSPSTTPTSTPTVKPSSNPTTKPTSSPTTKPAPTPTPDYEKINREMVNNLQAVSDDIALNEGNFSDDGWVLITKIKSCIDGTIKQADSNIIDADFVKKTYKTEIGEAEALYNKIMANNRAKADFQNALGSLETDTILWLAEQFGVI